MPPSLRILVVLVCLAALPATASAQTVVQGSKLIAPANYTHGCETRWLPSFSGIDQPTNGGPSTCTVLHMAPTAETGFLVPGEGKVRTARVKSGPNPAPLSIVTIRRYFKPAQDGSMQYTCCYGVSETPTFTPKPNDVTEVPVDLLVSTRQPEHGQTGWWDIVAVNAHGPGSLPMSDLGPHYGVAPATMSTAWWTYPRTAPGENNQNEWFSSNFEVLMQYTWEACTAASAARAVARAAQACEKKAAPPVKVDTPPAPPAVVPPPPRTVPPAVPTAPVAPAEVAAKRLTLKGKLVKLAVKCLGGSGCNGTVRLRTKARKSRVLATGKVTVAAGRTGTVRLSLSPASRRLVKPKGTKVTVDVDLGAAGRVTRELTLRRG